MRYYQQGFTLFNLMLSLAILGLIIGLGIPSYVSIIKKSTKNSQANLVFSSLQFARYLAVTKEKSVLFCFSPDKNICDRESSQYLLVFTDINENRQAEQEEIIRLDTFGNSKPSILLSVSGARHYMRFKANGTTSEPGRITICPKDRKPEYASGIIVNFGGRVRIARDFNGDGIVEIRAGENITCE